MSAYSPNTPLGTPGSFPLPVKGEAGSAYMANQKMHPAAMAAMAAPSRQNPMNSAAATGGAPGGGSTGGAK
jgi:hypothetical protein